MLEAMKPDEIPSLAPRFASQPVETPWPTRTWPRAEVSNQRALDEVVNEAFTQDDLAITNAVVHRGRRQSRRRTLRRATRVLRSRPGTRHRGESPALVVHGQIHAPHDHWHPGGRRRPLPRPARARARMAGGRPTPAATFGCAICWRCATVWPSFEEYEIGQTSHVIEMLFGEGKEDMAAFTAALPLAHPPDTVFNYSSGTTNILSRIVADQVGYGTTTTTT